MSARPPTSFCPRCGTRRSDATTCARDGTPLVEVAASSLLGTEVGNYVIVQALGEGGMGAVYRAVHPAIGAEVAVKVLHTSAAAHAQRFLVEAQAVNRVRHPSLIRILDTGHLEDHRPYLVMELLDGISLADAVGKLAPALACHVAIEALEALDAVHEEGIVHRDLKPANVFLTRDGRTVVLDFGIAKLVDDQPHRTHSSGLIGTPEYMAPEQIRSQPIDRRTDVYAMGILLYETITGRRPFAATATFEMLVQHLERPPTSPRDYAPNLAPAIADAILRSIEKEPARRFATARAMAEALRAASAPASREALAALVASHAGPARPVALETPAPRLPAVTTPERPRAAIRDAATGALAATRRELPPSAAGPTAKEKLATLEDPRPLGRAAPSPRGKRPLALGLVAGALALVGATLAVLSSSSSAPGNVGEAMPPVDADPVRTDAAATGVLEIRSSPVGVEIMLDGVTRGTTPLSLTLAPRSYQLHAALAGHSATEEVVEVRTGERTNVVLQLSIAPAVVGAPGSGSSPAAGRGRRRDTGTGTGSASTMNHARGSAATASPPPETPPGAGAGSEVRPEGPAGAGSAQRPDRRKPNPFEDQ